jgi:hypothetical protein
MESANSSDQLLHVEGTPELVLSEFGSERVASLLKIHPVLSHR